MKPRRVRLRRATRVLAGLAVLMACSGGTDPEAVAPTADSEPLVRNRDNPGNVFRAALIGADEDGRWLEFDLQRANRQVNLPINNPPVVHASRATHMRDDDYVVGILLDDEARAYPWWILSSGHVTNDLVGRKPIFVAMCEACSGVSAFRATVGGRVLDFRIAGLRNGTWFASDHQTGSFWHPFRGVAWRGPLAGSKLERIRTYQSRWGRWRRDHPDSSVLLGSPEMRARAHANRDGHPKRPGSEANLDPERIRPSTVNPRRAWYPDSQMMFGLIAKDGRSGRAYPLESIHDAGGLVQDDFDSAPVALVAKDEFQVGAYSRRVGSDVLDLRVVATVPIRLADQLGNVWDEWGEAVSGPSVGQHLSQTDGYLTEWYEWVYSFPESSVYGRDAEAGDAG